MSKILEAITAKQVEKLGYQDAFGLLSKARLISCLRSASTRLVAASHAILLSASRTISGLCRSLQLLLLHQAHWWQYKMAGMHAMFELSSTLLQKMLGQQNILAFHHQGAICRVDYHPEKSFRCAFS